MGTSSNKKGRPIMASLLSWIPVIGMYLGVFCDGFMPNKLWINIVWMIYHTGIIIFGLPLLTIKLMF